MSISIRKTKKGHIVINDGFSEYYRAYVQGNMTYTVYIPDRVLLKNPNDDFLVVLAETVAKVGCRVTPIEQACRALSRGKIQ